MSTENNKYKNTRVLKFKEDFNPSKGTSKRKPGGEVLFKKGEQAAVHVKLMNKLRERGAEFEVIEVDFNKAEEKAREALRKNRSSYSKD